MTAVEVRSSGDVARALDRWLPGLSESTRAGYSRDVTAWLNWCHDHRINPLEASGRDFGEYLDSLKERLRPASRARRYSAINSWYRWLIDEGAIVVRPEPPKSARPKVTGLDSARWLGLTSEQATALLASARADGPRSEALVALLLTTALRIQAALNVKIGDLRPQSDGSAWLTVVEKGEKVQTKEVPPGAYGACLRLAGDRGPRDWLFLGARGGQWHQTDARRVAHRLGGVIGADWLHPHALRHTAASLSLDSGSNILAVKAFLGHAQLSTTERYVQAAATIRESPAQTLEGLVGGGVVSG